MAFAFNSIHTLAFSILYSGRAIIMIYALLSIPNTEEQHFYIHSCIQGFAKHSSYAQVYSVCYIPESKDIS